MRIIKKAMDMDEQRKSGTNYMIRERENIRENKIVDLNVI